MIAFIAGFVIGVLVAVLAAAAFLCWVFRDGVYKR